MSSGNIGKEVRKIDFLILSTIGAGACGFFAGKTQNQKVKVVFLVLAISICVANIYIQQTWI